MYNNIWFIETHRHIGGAMETKVMFTPCRSAREAGLTDMIIPLGEECRISEKALVKWIDQQGFHMWVPSSSIIRIYVQYSRIYTSCNEDRFFFTPHPDVRIEIKFEEGTVSITFQEP
jgi:hypothetical protein